MTSSSSEAGPAAPIDVTVFKSLPFVHGSGTGVDGGHLPYRLDHLAGAGIRLHWSDVRHRRAWSRAPLGPVLARLEGAGAPFLQTVALSGRIAHTDAVLAMFESEAMFLASLRGLRLWPYTRPRLVVVTCWLAELLPRFGPRRLRWYRRAYARVDRLAYFSSNQRAVYRRYLDLPEERLAFVPYGVDENFFVPPAPDEEDGGYVLAVGRDRGRDWPTFFEAAWRTGLPVKLACRASDIAGMDVPPNVEVLGYVERTAYRDLLARARTVVVPTHVLAYPTGQSVTLEAMATARACVVTDTPAMRDYVQPGVTALTVPPRDAAALAAALTWLHDDSDHRSRLGARARAAVEERFRAQHLWASVARLIREAVAER